MQRSSRLALAAILLGLPAAAGPAGAEPSDAAVGRGAGDAVPDMPGVVVHVLSARTAARFEPGSGAGTIVHALAPTDEVTRAVRTGIQKAGRQGLASAETRATLNKLPYARYLLNAAVVHDLDDATNRGLRWSELFRVVVPRGLILVGGDMTAEAVREKIAKQHAEQGAGGISRTGRWVCVTTRWQDWMSESTHNVKFTAGARRIPPGRRDPQAQGSLPTWIQWIDQEHNCGPRWSVYAKVSLNGRYICLSNAETAAYVRDGLYWLPVKSWDKPVLSARDAFNGTLLWTRPWNGRLRGFTALPMAAKDDLVYTIENGRLTATEATNGEVTFAVLGVRLYDADNAELCCDAGTIVVRTPARLEAFDALTGSKRWAIDGETRNPVADRGRLFVSLLQADRPAREKSAQRGRETAALPDLVAFDIGSGRRLWRRSEAALTAPKTAQRKAHDWPATVPCSAERGLLIVRSSDRIAVLNGKDGGVVREIKATGSGQGHACLVGEHLYADGALYALATGKPVARPERLSLPKPLGVWACGPGTITGQMILDALNSAKRGATDPVERKRHEFLGDQGVHIMCKSGPLVANGLTYQQQQSCGCSLVNHRPLGFIATSAAVPYPPRDAFTEPGSLERGPGYGRVSPDSPAAGDWPTFRGDTARSGAGTGSIPRRLVIVWTRRLAGARPRSRIVKYSWRANRYHNGVITAPVVAGGRVYVALPDEHQVAAIHAADGAIRWRFTAGARIDSPPTLYDGLCLFGCRDGAVYCLDAHTGDLVWRRRITPVDERIVVYGQLESRFPAIGSVLIEKGKGYATAGLSGSVGIMLYTFDPRTGEALGYARLPRTRYINDILRRRSDGRITMVDVAIDGSVIGPPPLFPAAARRGLSSPAAAGPPDLALAGTELLATVRTQAAYRRERGVLQIANLSGLAWTWRGHRLFGYLPNWAWAESAGRIKGLGPAATNVMAGAAVYAFDAALLSRQPDKAVLWSRAMPQPWTMASTEHRLIVAYPVPRVVTVGPGAAAGRTEAQPPSGGEKTAPQAIADDAAAPPGRAEAKSPSSGEKTAVVFTPGLMERLARQAEETKKRIDAKTAEDLRRLREGVKPDVPPGFPKSDDPLWPATDVWGRWEPRQEDPLRTRGEVVLLQLEDGQTVTTVPIPSCPVQDGMATAAGRIYISTADGSLLCLGLQP